jgi:uroporphyrin-III C-methyltransferase
MGRIVGKVYLVGAGPGAPDLLTLRAAELLKRANVVFYDALVHPDIVQLAGQARKIAVGKRAGRLSTNQRFINRALVEAGLRHACVVRLKGGDPMLFGRAQEEIDALNAAGVEVEVVPGVTTALAAAASLGTSLTCRGVSRSVTFATARVGQGETGGGWAEAVAGADTAILYMALGEAEKIQRELLAQGLNSATPVIIVENASLPSERHSSGTLATLPTLAQANFQGPTILCVGEVFRAISQAGVTPIFPEEASAARAGTS